MTKVSVIIPTYNRADHVKEAVESVLQQSFTDFEILVVDNGSTDDVRTVIKQIPDDRIRYFYKDNGVLASARNFGLIKALSKYIAFLDDDDLYSENYLEVMVRCLEKEEEYGMAYSQFTNIYPDGTKVKGFGSDRYLSGWQTRNFFGKMPCILPSAIFLRNSVLKDFFFDETLRDTEDIDFSLRLSARTRFVCVPDASVIRRISPDSMSSAADENLSVNTALILERFYQHFGGKEIVPWRKAKRKIGRKYFSLGSKHYQRGDRKAAILLFRKAISCYPFDSQFYSGLLKAYSLSKQNDTMPDWEIPDPLPLKITTPFMQQTQDEQV